MWRVTHRHDVHYHSDPEVEARLLAVETKLDLINRTLANLPEKIMANIRPEIQAVLDAINSLKAPLAALEAVVDDEMKQIVDLTAKVAAGGALTDEEKTALRDAASTVNSAIADVVAKTPAATTAAAAATT